MQFCCRICMKKEFSSQLRKMLLFSSKWPPWRRLLCERHCSSFSTLPVSLRLVLFSFWENLVAQMNNDTRIQIFAQKVNHLYCGWIKRGQSSLFTLSLMNKYLALPLPSHHRFDKRLSKNIMDWSHSWVTSLEEEQPSWIGLSIMWGQSFREFSWRFL